MNSTERDSVVVPRWWTRNRFWLAGALMMATVTLGYSWHTASEAYALNHRVTPIRVASGQTGRYEGARWRVLNARLIDTPNPRLRLHPQAALLVVDYQAVPDATTTLRRLDQCRGRLSDGGSRHWDAYDRLPAGVLEGITDGCGGRGATAAGPVRFQHAYEVPGGLPLASFRPEIYFLAAEKSAPGSYLRFEL